MPLPGGRMEIIMNKREISEIKKQFKRRQRHHPHLRLLRGRRKKYQNDFERGLFALSEEEIFKYYEIFKRPFPGIGKISTTLEYSIRDEGEDSAHALLMKLREEKLADDETVDSFYNKVIENYDYGGKLLHHTDPQRLRCSGKGLRQ